MRVPVGQEKRLKAQDSKCQSGQWASAGCRHQPPGVGGGVPWNGRDSWVGGVLVTHRCRVTGSKQGGQIRVFTHLALSKAISGLFTKRKSPAPSLSSPAASLTSPGGPAVQQEKWVHRESPVSHSGTAAAPALPGSKSSGAQPRPAPAVPSLFFHNTQGQGNRPALRPGQQLVTRGRQPRAGVGRTAWPRHVCFSAS